MNTGRVSRAPLVVCAIAFALVALRPSGAAEAQEPNPAHVHIAHIVDSFQDTPEGEGLLSTARAEAEIAERHARLAAGDRSNLQGMQLHARHVLHALDPSRVESGPGMGYGVKQAAEGIARHVRLAAEAEGASEAVRTHAEHVATAAMAVADRVDEIVAVVDQIENAYDYTEAGDYVGRLRRLTGQLVSGVDVDGNGQVTWQGGEGGLQNVERHVQLMVQAEGL